MEHQPLSSHTGQLNIEVVYASSTTKQTIISLQVPISTNVQQAISNSGILKKFPEINLANCKIGIFGKLVKPTTLVNSADRIEIYRPLGVHPMQNRRIRAKQQQASTAN